MNFVTPFILFVLGVLLWRQQLSSKRRFEVAEQMLAAFHRASDGLSTLRSPMIWAGEIEAAKPKRDGDRQDSDDPPMTKSEEQQRRQRRAEIHNVYVARGATIAPAFAELRTAQILAEIHFGRPAADAMGVVLRGRREVFAAVLGLYSGPFADYFPTAEMEEHHRQFEVSMQRLLAELRAEDGKPDETDALSQRVDAACATLEDICRPALAGPWWMPGR